MKRNALPFYLTLAAREVIHVIEHAGSTWSVAIVSGAPGTGKSAVARWISCQSDESRTLVWDAPVPNSPKALVHGLMETFGRTPSSSTRRDFWRLVGSGLPAT